MFYQVGNEKFTNKFLASKRAAESGLEVRFNLHEETFDRADWSQEPKLTWNQLLDIRANQIAAKGKPIVLNFSGGTDSYTIYKVFERNNIHIDVLFVRQRNTELDLKLSATFLEFLNNGVYDPTTKIIISEDRPEIFEMAYANENWIWETNTRPEFSVGFNADSVSDLLVSRALGTDDFISVSGLEKPRLVFDWHGVYSYQLLTPFYRAIGNKIAEPFYVTPELPELHIKQSYMLMHYIKSLKPGARPLDLKELSFKISDATKWNWNEYSTACGRFGDLANSGYYHSAWETLKITIPKNGKLKNIQYSGPGKDWFESLAGTQALKNYNNGIMSIYSDSMFKEINITGKNFCDLIGINSKYYKMNFLATPLV